MLVLLSSKYTTIEVKSDENQNYMTAKNLSDNDYMTNLINDMIDEISIDDIYGEYVYKNINVVC